MKDILARLKSTKHGTVTVGALDDETRTELNALAAAKHAITVEQVTESNGIKYFRIYHYLSCETCKHP